VLTIHLFDHMVLAWCILISFALMPVIPLEGLISKLTNYEMSLYVLFYINVYLAESTIEFVIRSQP